MYVEKALVPARHVEIQVLCDTQGNVLTLGERECSIQRRHQKLIEESPSAALTAETRDAMEAAAERACRAVGYRNAGTFEFLLGPDGSFYFIELNARLQVEHPVTEMCTGIDLVREQLLVAAGEQLSVTGRAPRRGHAIEIRLNAEDPEHDFRPSPGRIARFQPAQGPGVRVDTFVESGTMVPPFYDSLIAKLIVWDTSPRRRDRARGACVARDRRRGRPDDAGARARRARERAVPQRRLLDVDARPVEGRRMPLSRRQARRQALMLLYQWDLSGQEIGSQYAGEIDPWARGVAEAVARARGRARRAHHGRRRKAGRPTGSARSSGARCASRCTSSRRGDVPAEVAINEAVAFAKRYASEDAARLVNGILGRSNGRRHDVSAEESLNNAEDLLARLEAGPRRGSRRPSDPDQAIEILQELAELAKEVEAELQRAKRAAETEAVGAADPDAAAG